MARLFYLTILMMVFAFVSVSAFQVEVDMEDEAPVPEGFSLPNIFNPVLDRADGRDQAKTLVNLVAKEPKVAYGVGGPEAPVEDTWNGEADPESSASVAQKKMLQEVDKLTQLIDQGKKILKILPRKEARLALLKRKLSKILDAKAKREASEKLDQQQALLAAIKKREEAMSSRLHKLKASQSNLEQSVGALQTVINGKPEAGSALPSVGATKVQVAAATEGTASDRAGHRFMEMDSEADIAADMESEAENESELDAENQMEYESEF